MNPKTQLPIRNLKENLILASFMIILLILLSIQDLFAQQPSTSASDTTQLVQIEVADGNKFIGRIVFQDQSIIRIQTEQLGILQFPRENVREIIPIRPDQIKEGGYWFENPQATRHFWAPNGYGLRKGEAYYQNVWILFNQFSVGVTNNFSVGFGLVPAFLFAGAATPMWITPKFSIPVSREKFNLGIGGLIGTSSLTEKGNGFGILYGMTTFGGKDKNISFGLGYGYSGGKMASHPTITMSALVRVSARGYFITENYYLGTSSLVLMSLGGRRMVNRTGIDFGLVIPIESGMSTLVAIPWLGITAPLHKR
ncbi:MAG: hypothetical protein JNK10_08385 [Cyclobacteriaceae bacterium]|nr:hypothetical protein [Cyclobacteriaceae bacterium]